MSTESNIEFVIEPGRRKLFNWGELWDYRELFYFFTWRDIKVKYKQTVLGIFWVFLQPVFMVLIFTFFFNRALHLPSEGLPYSVFAFSGLLLWNLFSSGVTNAGNSMLSNSQIIKKVYFPRLIIPLSSIISSTFDFFMGLAVFIVILSFFRISIDWIELIYCWPAALAIAFIGSSGIGCLVAALNIKYRDFRYIIPFVMQALLFLTPVIYPVSMLSQQWIKFILALNPMYAAIVLFRMPITTTVLDDQLFLVSILSCLILFISGVYYFKRTERYFADLA